MSAAGHGDAAEILAHAFAEDPIFGWGLGARNSQEARVRLFEMAVGQGLATGYVDVHDSGEAAAIWADYSPRWQFWNQTRTVFSGVALALAGFGLAAIRRDA